MKSQRNEIAISFAEEEELGKWEGCELILMMMLFDSVLFK